MKKGPARSATRRGIRGAHIGAAEQVVHAGMVKVREGAQHPRRDHVRACFVIGIRALRDVDGLRDLCLRQVAVFPQVADAAIVQEKHLKDIIKADP